MTCSEPYEWTDPTVDEWEFSAAVKARAGGEPFHVRLHSVSNPLLVPGSSTSVLPGRDHLQLFALAIVWLNVL